MKLFTSFAIVFASIMISATACHEDPLFDRDDYLLFCMWSDSKLVYSLEDMKDGTLLLTATYNTTPRCGLGAPSSGRPRYMLLKKCLQGQAYQVATNDCRGNGTAPYWGAQTFQYCPTDDLACQGPDAFNASSIASPAAASCANDTTAGKTWMLPAGSIAYPPLEGYRQVNFVQSSPDFPTGIGNQFWASETYNTYPPYQIINAEAKSIYFQPDGSFGVDHRSKSSLLFVHCRSREF